MQSGPSSRPTGSQRVGGYDERLHASPAVWLTSFALALGIVPVSLALLPLPGVLLVTAGTYAGIAALLRSWAAPVAVRDGELVAGRARIPVELLGIPEPLDADAAAHLRGQGIDPRAYHLIRPWVRRAVQVTVRDPQDPTPYWYVATRHPQRLVDALLAEQARVR